MLQTFKLLFYKLQTFKTIFKNNGSLYQHLFLTLKYCIINDPCQAHGVGLVVGREVVGAFDAFDVRAHLFDENLHCGAQDHGRSEFSLQQNCMRVPLEPK